MSRCKNCGNKANIYGFCASCGTYTDVVSDKVYQDFIEKHPSPDLKIASPICCKL